MARTNRRVNAYVNSGSTEGPGLLKLWRNLESVNTWLTKLIADSLLDTRGKKWPCGKGQKHRYTLMWWVTL